MGAGGATLGSAQMQGTGLKLHIGPLKLADLAGSEAMPEADQDHGGITLPPSIALGRLDQLLDLALRQVLAWPKLSRRRGATVRFTESGGTILKGNFAM